MLDNTSCPSFRACEKRYEADQKHNDNGPPGRTRGVPGGSQHHVGIVGRESHARRESLGPNRSCRGTMQGRRATPWLQEKKEGTMCLFSF